MCNVLVSNVIEYLSIKSRKIKTNNYSPSVRLLSGAFYAVMSNKVTQVTRYCN